MSAEPPNARTANSGFSFEVFCGPPTPAAIMTIITTVMMDANEIAARNANRRYERGSVKMHDTMLNTATIVTMQVRQPRYQNA